ncbi:lycopene cyclase family protein [Synechococcus sp. CB0101]|uniref:lycopene beta cyclase n=1 Tax=Synechococcus sp. CB0101 TaxID=232348 RepID=UPI00049749EE|nr:lycopene cyclase family protein [Synechococcus sp. CB0101]QCH15708.1 lycopene cyclase family protein [Synechococcus sp. CB0101]
MPDSRHDVVVIGAGPAALCIAAALAERGVAVQGLAPDDPAAPWPNTYGIWGPEVDALGLGHLLGHRWRDTRSYFGDRLASPAVQHGIDYGLFDKTALQQHWWQPCQQAGLVWHLGRAASIDHDPQGSVVITDAGERLAARLVIDASGHHSPFVTRPDEGPVAGQAAYGIVGRFSAPPVDPGQFVLMDYRCDHLSEAEQRCGPPTFLYAMDFGEGVFFAEETSLALAPAVPYDVLKDRLLRRLALRGITVEEVQHEEFCLFPMNLPLPDLQQRVVGFGGSAAMVHPASGYMVGALLRRAPALAEAIATGLQQRDASADQLACTAWQALWPLELQRKHALYRFGLEKLMRFSEPQLRAHFRTFFGLPREQWYGFLTNTLSLPQLIAAMVRLFITAPLAVKAGLMGMQGSELQLGLRMLRP